MILQINKILPLLNIEHGMSVLDIGSSVGFWARHIAELVGPTGKVVAVDVHDDTIKRLNRDAVELGRENLHGITGDILNLQNVPLKKELYDRVLLIRMLPVIESDIDRIIPELIAFTNTHGNLIIVDTINYKDVLGSFLNHYRDLFEYSFIPEIEARSDDYFFGIKIEKVKISEEE